MEILCANCQTSHPNKTHKTLLPTMARHSSGAKRGSKVRNCSNPGYTNRLIHKLHGSVPLCLCATQGLFGKFSRRVARRADPSLGHRRPPLYHESIWQPPDLSSLTVSRSLTSHIVDTVIHTLTPRSPGHPSGWQWLPRAPLQFFQRKTKNAI